VQIAHVLRDRAAPDGAGPAEADSDSPVGGDAAEQQPPLSPQVCLLLLVNLHTCTYAGALKDVPALLCWPISLLIYPPAIQTCFHARCWDVDKHHLCLSKASCPCKPCMSMTPGHIQFAPPQKGLWRLHTLIRLSGSC